MTDWNDLITEPDPAFSARLEAELIGALRSGAPSNAPHVDVDLAAPSAPSTRGGRRWPLVAAAVVIVAAGLVVGVVRDDDADSAAEAPAPTVRFDVAWPQLGGLERPECLQVERTYVWAEAGRCLRQFTGEVTITGDVTGTALWSMSGGIGRSDDADATVDLAAGFGATYLVKAEIAGCGVGEFVMTSSLSFVGWQAGGFVGEWQIVPGSGRDALADIEGGGDVLPQVPSGELDANLPRPHVGTITC